MEGKGKGYHAAGENSLSNYNDSCEGRGSGSGRGRGRRRGRGRGWDIGLSTQQPWEGRFGEHVSGKGNHQARGRAECIWRQRDGNNVYYGGTGSQSFAGPSSSRTSCPGLHQAIQDYGQSAHASRPAGYPRPRSPDSSLSHKSDLQQQFQQLSIRSGGTSTEDVQPIDPVFPCGKSAEFPPRPDMGKKGQKCMVRANHFSVKLSIKNIHHYHVSIKPEVNVISLNRAVMAHLVDTYGDSHLGSLIPAYDGRQSLYTAGPLPFPSKEFEVIVVGEAGGAAGLGSLKERKFNVSIKFASCVDMDRLRFFLEGNSNDMPQEAIQVLDIVLRQTPSSCYTPVRRSFYSPELGKMIIGDGLEAWHGFFQSIRQIQMSLSLNIDMSAAVFVEPLEVVDFVRKILNREVLDRPLSVSDRVKLKKALKGLKIEVTHRGNSCRKYRISDVTPEPTKELTFPSSSSGGGITKNVVQHFQETYGLNLEYISLPCLQVGSKQRPIYLPMEVCEIVGGQRYTKRLNDKQVVNFVKLNSPAPRKREDDIRKTVKNNSYDNDKYASHFGITVEQDPALVNARVLPAPRLKYNDTGRENSCQPRFGQWNMLNKKVVIGGTVNYWACINFTFLSDARVHSFCRALADKCNDVGMVFDYQPVIQLNKAQPEQVTEALKALHDKVMAKLKPLGKELDLLVMVLPDKNGSLYDDIKRICDTEIGLVSQCVLAKTVSKINANVLANIALKINPKVGGTNTVLDDALKRHITLVTDKPTIIFGADVTHPISGEDGNPSIAAVVASQDWPEVTKYAPLFSAQAGHQEIIQELSSMVKEHLSSFYAANGHQKPERIIFYRDGVGEGQFPDVREKELEAIRKGWNLFKPDTPVPPITFVVVQKRHHTRLFPINDDRKWMDKSGNVVPGTVVDTEICHPRQHDFFLCSHAGIKGTSQPAHYHVLWDDNKFTADDLQTLTHNLCYIYARCTRAVSYVAPAYYAHLVAYRARKYLVGDSSSDGSSVAGSVMDPNGEGADEVSPAVRGVMEPSRGGADVICATAVPIKQLPRIVEKLKNVMFYL